MTPFYTLELKDKKINQVRGRNNTDPTDDVKDFVARWCRKFGINPKIIQGY